MRHERPDVHMTQSQTPLDCFGVMRRGDQPVSVVPDVEDNKAIHIVGVGKTRPEFLKASPARRFHNRDPGPDLFCGRPMIQGRLLKPLDRDDVHR